MIRLGATSRRSARCCLRCFRKAVGADRVSHTASVLGGTYTPSFRAWFCRLGRVGTSLWTRRRAGHAFRLVRRGSVVSTIEAFLPPVPLCRLPQPSPASWSFTPPSLRSPGKRETVRVPSFTLETHKSISELQVLSENGKIRHSCTLLSPIFTWEGARADAAPVFR